MATRIRSNFNDATVSEIDLSRITILTLVIANIDDDCFKTQSEGADEIMKMLLIMLPGLSRQTKTI